jgi:hypothetical protein
MKIKTMKKQLKRIALTLCFCSFLSLLTAQNGNVDIATERNLMSKNISSKLNAEGSPYINENFSRVLINQYDDKIYVGRYNAFNGELEVKLAENNIIALDNNANYEVTFTSTNKIYKTENYITENGNSKRGFLIVFSEDENYTLYKEEHIKYYEKVEAASSYQQDKPAKFKKENDTYYIKLNNTVTFFPNKKRDLLKAFPKQAKTLKTYLKKNKLNPSNEDELVTIANYISTIVK